MGDITRQEFEEMLSLKKKYLPKMELEAQKLKDKHPRLYKDQIKKIAQTKDHIRYLENRLLHFEDTPSEITHEKIDTQKYQQYDITLSKTIPCSVDIGNIEGHHALKRKHYDMLLTMAKNQGTINAQDRIAKIISQDGEFTHNTYQDIELWTPLLKEKYITQTGQVLGTQSPFFKKAKSGEYRSHSKGMSGYEPSEYSIGKYELTSKGWEKADSIVDMVKRKTIRC